MLTRLCAMLVAAGLLAGCGGSVIPAKYAGGTAFDLRTPHCQPQPPAPSGDVTAVRYLGSGGVAISRGHETILLGPYFSHAGNLVLAQVGFVHPDRKRIETGLQHITASEVRAILLGHSHFDHIGDVPYLGDAYANVPIYANETGAALLSRHHLHAKAVHPGQTFDVTPHIRVTVHQWDHAPQLCRASRFPCTYAKCSVPPIDTTLDNMLMRDVCGGDTYAYVIEMRGRPGAAPFRIYYNDAAAGSNAPLPPAGQYDLAIICMASYDLVDGYPQNLLARLQPRHVLISHYEDFFRRTGSSWTFPPMLSDAKAEEFMRRLAESVAATSPVTPAACFCGVATSHWSMPMPDETLYFPAEADGP